MEQPERPLGLGILAVVSFGAALWNVQSGVYLILLVGGYLKLPEQPQMLAAYLALPEWFRWFLLVAAVVKTALLVVAAIGYFGRRRYARWAALAYAVVSLGESVMSTLYWPFQLTSLIGILFALFTLIAVNTMYKDQLTR